MIQLIREPIDTAFLQSQVACDDCGAIVLFVGKTRRWTGGIETVKLGYDAHESMAIKMLETLREQAMQRWDLRQVAIVHRLGIVAVGEASVAVAVASPHRQAAFEAAQWIIDTLKQEVPIWKQDFNADGMAQWIHPGLEGESS